jgi:polyferredoxin
MSLRTLRRISQWAIFLVFVFLFLNTEYKDNDVLPYAVNIFLRLDPLVAAAAAVSGRALISLVWPALIVAGLTILLGRFICGWACPMGSILDAVDATLFAGLKRKEAVPASWRKWKYLILVLLAGSALFTLQWVFFFDPVSILIRTFAVSVFPALNRIAHDAFGFLYQAAPGTVARVSEPAYGFLKAHFLAFEQPVFRTAAPVGLLFLSILAAEYCQKRFWCRNLCPLGAFLALLGRFGLFRRRVMEDGCTRCGLCEKNCRSGAIYEDVATYRGECVGCMDCRAICPEMVIRFSGKEGRREAAVDLTRRGVITSAAMGVLTVPFFRVEARRKAPDPALIRPPGALPAMRGVHEGLHRERAPADVVRSGAGRDVEPGPRAEDRVLRIQLHPLRAGVPDRRDPAAFARR